LAVWVVATVRRNYLLVAVTVGSITRNIAAAPPIETELRQIVLEGRLVVTPWPTARLAPGSRSADRAAIFQVTAAGRVVQG
jgi:hypothetical protein